MEPSKSEKIEVKFGPSKNSTSSSTTEQDGGFAHDMHVVPGSTVPPSQNDENPESVQDKKDASNPSIQEETDETYEVANDLQPSNLIDGTNENTEGLTTEQKDTDLKSDESRAGTKEEFETGGQDVEESAEEDEIASDEETADIRHKSIEFDDFYSSKLQIDGNNQRTDKKATRKGGQDRQAASSRQYAHNSWRVWILLLIFIITASAGWVTLYQLEEQSPGSGIIFDWF